VPKFNVVPLIYRFEVSSKQKPSTLRKNKNTIGRDVKTGSRRQPRPGEPGIIAGGQRAAGTQVALLAFLTSLIDFLRRRKNDDDPVVSNIK
jgi:hypothetical protein